MVEDAAVHADARIRHQAGQLPEAVLRRVDERGVVGGQPRVGDDRDRVVGAQLLDHRGQPVAMSRAQGDLGARGHELPGRRGADPRRGAGDRDDVVGKDRISAGTGDLHG